MDRLLLKPTDLCDILSVSRSKAYDLLKTKTIPSVHIGRSVRVRTSDLQDWVDSQYQKDIGTKTLET
jgi:excisionase family DNA binding protein